MFNSTKNIFVPLIWAISFTTVLSQKGLTPINRQPDSVESHNTYAVIIGISDYQSPQIPDLQFADRDAIELLLKKYNGKINTK